MGIAACQRVVSPARETAARRELSPRLAEALRVAGHEAVRVRSLGLQRATDEQVFARAAAEHAVLVTEDTDFGGILTRRRARELSLILFRSADPLTPDQQAALLLAELPLVDLELAAGSVLLLGRSRPRLRVLPFGPSRDV